jgi:hypothetical protein
MFNPGRLLQFLSKILFIAIPFLLAVLALAIVTELVTQEGTLAQLLLSWRFWLAVGINILPAIIVMMLVLWMAARFVHALYGLDSWKQGIGFLLRSRCGLAGFKPWMKVEKGEMVPAEDKILTRLGGPGHLVVYNDSAVVLEQGGRLTKVVGAGFPHLERFEKVFEVIDLRPKRWVNTVTAMTREGIPISWDAEVHYQIEDDGVAPTEKSPFPLSEDCVFRAATSKWSFSIGGTETLDWEGRVNIGATIGTLRTLLARRRLDELIGLTEEESQAARESLQNQLEEELRQSAPSFGAKILEVKLDNLKVGDEVTQQWIRAWQARWEQWSSDLLAEGEADHIRLFETAKAKTQIRLVADMAKALQRLLARQVLTPRAITQIVLMRLFSVLDRADFGASSRIFVPSKALESLESMRGLMEDNRPLDEPA